MALAVPPHSHAKQAFLANRAASRRVSKVRTDPEISPQINERVLSERIERFRAVVPRWNQLIADSFLSPEKKAAYAAVLAERKDRLQL